ncbi:MAG TPA: acyltransferase [Thermoleophilaceae bacterium]|nr:acyltransferase [Thermoleophilaceae bacterium]
MGTGSNNWLAAGDPLRGIAAFGVLLFHVAVCAVIAGGDTIQAGTLGAAGRILFNLDAGVFLFFLLSGYLIGRPFASAFVLQTPFPRVGRYLVRRMLRLGPGVLAATALAIVLFGRDFTDATVHFWTLRAEAWFYVALPAVTALALPLSRPRAGRRARAALWVGGCVVASLASLWFRARGTPWDLAHQDAFPSVGFAFAPGLALAGVEPVVAPVLRAAHGRTSLAAGLALLLAGAAAVAYVTVPRQEFMKHSVLAVAAATLLFGAVLLRDWAGRPPWRLLDNRPLQWLGERSYSLYLFHLPLVAKVARELGTSASASTRVVVVAAAAIPVSLGFAWVGYELVERPFMRARKPSVPAELPVVPVGSTA